MVHPHMFAPLATLHKGLGADRAVVRPFTSVETHVGLEVVPCRELLRANFTLIWPLTRVTAQV